MGLFSDRRHPVLIAPTAEEDDGLRIRVWLLGLFTVVLFAALTVQLVRLQVFRHEEFEARATINRIRNITTPAERGLIFDRNGNPLVENVPAFAISVIPADVPDGLLGDAQKLARCGPSGAGAGDVDVLDRSADSGGQAQY